MLSIPHRPDDRKTVKYLLEENRLLKDNLVAERLRQREASAFLDNLTAHYHDNPPTPARELVTYIRTSLKL